MEFNRIIKLLRTERGITQKQAAEDLHISQALLSHYEKGIRECGPGLRRPGRRLLRRLLRLSAGPQRRPHRRSPDSRRHPQPDKMKDNVYHGSVLPHHEQKADLQQPERPVRQGGPVPQQGPRHRDQHLPDDGCLQDVPPAVHQRPSQCGQYVQHQRGPVGRLFGRRHADAEANVSVLLSGGSVKGDGGVEDTAPLAMTTESLTREFPLYTSSLLNLVKTSETRIRSLTPPEENGK